MLSRAVVFRLLALGHFAERVSDVGLAGWMDHQIWREAFRRDATMITSNEDDFLNLARCSEIHAGLILLRSGELLQHEQIAWVETAIQWIQRRRADLVNTVIEVSGDTEADVKSYPLPPGPPGPTATR